MTDVQEVDRILARASAQQTLPPLNGPTFADQRRRRMDNRGRPIDGSRSVAFDRISSRTEANSSLVRSGADTPAPGVYRVEKSRGYLESTPGYVSMKHHVGRAPFVRSANTPTYDVSYSAVDPNPRAAVSLGTGRDHSRPPAVDFSQALNPKYDVVHRRPLGGVDMARQSARPIPGEDGPRHVTLLSPKYDLVERRCIGASFGKPFPKARRRLNE